ncbi:MAG: glycosyltransferase family 39 protein [Elusimicrobia bacterium]|nr:glycosyltransferase family 39 protein [Elusimicrobiota bacterium]
MAPKALKRFDVPAALGVILLAAAALRLWAIHYGLPAVFNADEPHIVNTAVSFGSGSLRPHAFKYPTLWMYILFGAYGAYYAAWSLLGLLHSVREFGALYVWNPTCFYLIARVLSAAASIAALERVYRTAAILWGESEALWATGLLAVSPVLVIAAHAAKPDSFMFLLAAWAWWFSARYWRDGNRRDLLLCGAAAGFAVSTQFTAAPLAALLPAAFWARGGRRSRTQDLAYALGAAALAFAATSPFVIVDFPKFLTTLRDQRALEGMGSAAGMWMRVMENVGFFVGTSYSRLRMDETSLATLGPTLRWMLEGLSFWSFVVPAAVAIGAGRMTLLESRKAAMVLLPVAVAWLLLSRSPEGSWQRYLFAVFPAIAFAAAKGFTRLIELYPRRRGVAVLILAILAGGGGFLECWSYDKQLGLPDTRTLAARWFAANVPPGSRVLLDQEHASPRLPMIKDQVEQLAAATAASGHPRARYYDSMRAGHPGGGYWLLRVRRDARDLHTNPALAEESARGQPTLDVREGLSQARKAGVGYIVLSSHGADPKRSPDLRPFLEETDRDCELLIQYSPVVGRITGPELRVYKIGPGMNRSSRKAKLSP